MSGEFDGVRVVHHSFRYVQAGATVRRILGGALIDLRVTEVDYEFIYCGPRGAGWKFDRTTGIEVDAEIGWGPQFGVAGSYLLHPYEEPPADDPPSRSLPRKERGVLVRDPTRIDRISEKLRRTWHLVPDWRLGQLVSNLLGPGPRDVFFPEDGEWEALLDEALEQAAQSGSGAAEPEVAPDP